MSGTGFNYIREIMQMNLPEESTPKPLREYESEAKRRLNEQFGAPKKFRFISRLKQPIYNSFRRDCIIENLLTARPRCYLASPNDVVMDGNKLYTWTGEKWEQFVPGPCTDYDGPNPYEKRVVVSTAPSIDTPRFVEMILEETNVLMDQLGIGYDAPSAIEQHGDIVTFNYDVKYIGETVTDIVNYPKRSAIGIRHIDPYTRIYYARIGNVVTYKGVEYIYTGESDGWKVFEAKFQPNNKEENEMLTGDMIRYVGQTTTPIIVSQGERTIRMTGGYHHSVTVGDIVRYKNDLYMFVDDPNPQKLPHWICLVKIVPDKPNTAYHKIPAGLFVVKKVVFNAPATIVFWEDGSKTIVRCGEGDTYDPEKGLAMAFAKKALGNQGNYYNTIKKWLSEPEETIVEAVECEPVIDEETSRKTAVKVGKKIKEISTLITDMALNGATNEEIERVVQYSMAVIDTIKNGETCTRINKEFNIKELRAKYQPE